MELRDIWRTCILLLMVYQTGAYTKYGKVSPRNPAVLVGNDLKLTCTITKSTSFNSSHLYFTFKNKIIPKSNYEIISSKSIAFTKTHSTSNDSGKYYCYIRTGNDSDLYVNGQQVDVGSPPEPAKHMTCVSHNWENMECDWCPEHEQENISWKLIWTVDLDGNKPQWHNCTKYINKAGFGKCICYFCGYGELPYHECAGRAEKTDFYPHTIYHMRVVATDGKMVSETKNFTIDLTPELVKPSPVQQFRVNWTESRSIQIQWKHPSHLEPEHFPLLYYVTCSSKWGPLKLFNTTNQDYLLTDLVPYTDYNISVRCKPKDGGYISNAMAMLVTTKEDAPSRPVELSQGGYHIQPVSCDNKSKCHKIRLFWKRIPLKYRNGIISSYIFRFNSTAANFRLPSFLLTKSHSCVSHVLTSLSLNEAYTITVIANTVIGPSPPATIFIDKSSNMPSIPADIQIEYLEDNSGVTVMWSPPAGGVTGFSIHHCIGQRDRGCQGDIESVPVAATENQTRYALNLTLPQIHERIFALSTERGRSSSGMTKWECVYQYNEDPGIPNFWFSNKQEEKSLTIEWQKLVCGQQSRGRVLKYKVFWCKVTKTNSCEEKNTEIDAQHNQFKIQNLSADTYYSVSMIAVAHTRVGGRSKREQYQTLTSKPDGTPRNVKAENVTSSSIILSWQPSLVLNGKITHHNIYIQDGDMVVKKVVSGSQLQTTVHRLNGYTNYSIKLTTCNKAGCSDNSTAIYAFTDVKAPAQIDDKYVSVKMKDNQMRRQAEIKWQTPFPPNGRIAYYEVLVWQGKAEKPVTYHVNLPKRSLLVNVSCQEDVVGVNFSVVAVNVDGINDVYRGFPSVPKSLDMCIGPVGYAIPLIITILAVVIMIIVLVLALCRKHVMRMYENCCGKDDIKVPERQPKVPLTVEVDVGDYDHALPHSLPPSSPSDRLIPEDDESLDSMGALMEARLPPGLLNSSPGSRTSAGSSMIHRDTSPLMSVSSYPEDGATYMNTEGHSVHDGDHHPVHDSDHQHKIGQTHSPQLHTSGHVYHNKPTRPGNVRLSTASSDMGYSQFDTLTPSGYVTLPEDKNMDTGSTILLDTGHTDYGGQCSDDDAGPVTDYSKLGLQNLTESQEEDSKQESCGITDNNVKKTSVAGSLISPLDGHKSKMMASLKDSLTSPQQEITVGRVEIERFDQDLSKEKNVSAAPSDMKVEQLESSEHEGNDRAQSPPTGQNLKCTGYVPVTDMKPVEPGSVDDAESDYKYCNGGNTDHPVSPYCQLDQVTATTLNSAELQSQTEDTSLCTEKNRSPSEPPVQRDTGDRLKNISLANSVSNSRDSLNSSVRKSNSANSSLDSSRSRSSSLEESSPTSGLGSNGSSMESMDQSPVKQRYPRGQQARRIPGYGNRNNSNNNNTPSQCVLEMSDFDHGQLQEEVDQRRKKDGYV